MMAENPQYVVEKSMFFANQFPYLEVRRPFILGTRAKKWQATLSHRCVEVLHAKGKLTRLYTQNIDGLDYQCTTIPTDKIVPVHGSIGRVACEGCDAPTDFDSFCSRLRTNIKDIYKDRPKRQGRSHHLWPSPEESIPPNIIVYSLHDTDL